MIRSDSRSSQISVTTCSRLRLTETIEGVCGGGPRLPLLLEQVAQRQARECHMGTSPNVLGHSEGQRMATRGDGGPKDRDLRESYVPLQERACVLGCGARFALKPIETAEDGSSLTVQFHWMPPDAAGYAGWTHFSPPRQQIIQDFDEEED